MVIALVMMSIGLGVKMKEVDKNKEITIEKRQESIPLIININTASMTELETLPRIGPVTAKKIIDFRQTYGTFKKPEDIIKVSGIGEKTYEKIKGQIGI
jgi:comEA protein